MFKYNKEISFGENTSHGELLKLFGNGETVLEFGCGNGEIAGYINEKLECKVYALEISQSALDNASNHLVKGVCCDVEAYDWEKEFDGVQFDTLLFADVLEHLKNPVEVIRRALALLKPDGKVLLSLPNVAHGDVILKLLNNHFDYTETGLLDDTHLRFFAKENLVSFLEKAGLCPAFITGVSLPVGSTEQGSDVSDELRLLVNSFDYHDIFQFVICAHKSEFARENSIALVDNCKKSSQNIVTLYFDIGNGFNDEQKLTINASSLDICASLPSGTRRVRVDLRENDAYFVSNLIVSLDNEAVEASEKHGVVDFDGFYLIYGDSQFVFDVNSKGEIKINGSILPFVAPSVGASAIASKVSSLNEELTQKSTFISHQEKIISQKDEIINEHLSTIDKKEAIIADKSKAISEKDKEIQEKCSLIDEKDHALAEKDLLIAQKQNDIESLRDHYSRAMEQIHALEQVKDNLFLMYSTVVNSFFWKITKPFRWALDIVKKICKKIPPLRLLGKGLRCLKQNGFKYTWRKIKDRKHHNKVVKEAQLTPVQLEEQASFVFDRDIKFSILVPLYNTPKDLLCEMIQSVMNQTYANWELCLADGSDENHAYVEQTVKELIEKDNRIVYSRLKQNLGISENTNECERMATGDFIGLLDHDDLLAPNALFENARAICETDADVLYSDEDHLSLSGAHVNPFYKPDFSPDLLHSQMYICHFTVIKRELFEAIGGFNSKYDGSQDYDLLLRLTEVTDKICHIPMVLYTWRECEGSTAANADAKPYAHIAGRTALNDHLQRVYGPNAHADDSEFTFVFDARYGGLEQNPLISIIMPMKDNWEMSDNCVRSIIEKSSYQNFEILILDNRSTQGATFEWFEKIKSFDSRIKVIKADMEFNWSKINNFGISKAHGDVYVFLNNDTLVITEDWLERLAENALRDDIGVVGALLLYEDNTIQHAGVVVGMGGWADHIFKGMSPIHFGAPYVSPMVSRNALAVTGACMAISKKTIDKIGGFDETFIICGSDIEMCIRAYQNGLYNKYDANVRLYHLESKSRDSYIPEIDFKRSYETYTPYRENIDPFFNINLDTDSLSPKERIAPMGKMNFRNFLKRCPVIAPVCRAIKRAMMPPAEYNIPEIGPIGARVDTRDNKKLRLNLLTPSVDVKHVFGGISTAIKFFEELRKHLGCDARIITVDAPVEKTTSVAPDGYKIVSCADDTDDELQLVSFSDRYNKTIPVRENDVFMSTGWWTAYTIKAVIDWQRETFGNETKPLIYMIQDYEPGFYPWSSRYMMADSTYRMDIPVYAVMNSTLLREFFDKNDYTFAKTWSFDPILNEKLAAFLPQDNASVEKKKQIIVYGRPSTERNAFALLVAGLKLWREKQGDASEWELLSAGEGHDDVDLGDGVVLKSMGKLSLEEYAQTMLDTYAGVSLMVSPHPSYPPLEMSTFGIKTITNCYANKDMSSFNDNIVSLKSCSPYDIANALCSICENYNGKGSVVSDSPYAKGGAIFGDIVSELSEELK